MSDGLLFRRAEHLSSQFGYNRLSRKVTIWAVIHVNTAAPTFSGGLMKRCLLSMVVLFVVTAAFAAAPADPGWPSLQKQMEKAHVIPGKALDRLIRAHQDFSVLRPDEASDNLGIPPWLRVYWRKGHPEATYSASDPTKGYPRVINEVLEWMISHQDLVAGMPNAKTGFMTELATPGAELRVSGAQSTARSESDIRINYWNPNLIISASNAIVSGGFQAMFSSSDGGATWAQTSLPSAAGDTSHSDPTVDWTSEGTAWSTTIGVQGNKLAMRSYKSANSGASWVFDATFSGTQTNTDKQFIWTDHSATSAYKDNLYAIWHNGNPAFMNRRTGPGGSWGTPIQVSGSESTGTAIGADVKTNSSGDVFGFWPATGNSGLFVVKSTTGGVSYGTPVRLGTTFDSYDIGVPSFASRRALIYISGGAYRSGTKNNVYAVWTDLTGATGCSAPSNEPGTNVSSTCKTRIWFARSLDGGATWGSAKMLNNQSSLNDQFNQSLAVDENTGAIGVIYYDTVAHASRLQTDVYYQSSFDDGATWGAATRVTTAGTDETTSTANSGNQYGDYNGLSGWAGKFFPSWTDRRTNAKEEIWTSAVSDPATACTPPNAPAGTAASASGTQVSLSWGSVTGATEYHVYRSITSGGGYAQIAAPTTNSYIDAGLSAGTYFYVVRAFAVCESANSNEASATVAGTGSSDFSLSIAPSSVTLTRSGGVASYTVTITRTGGFTGTVALSVSGLPAGVASAFNPQQATGVSSSLTLTVDPAVARGTYPFTVSGTSGSLNHSAAGTLVKSNAK